jgi:hypothetical protein
MTGSCSPFSLPANLPPELVKVRNYQAARGGDRARAVAVRRCAAAALASRRRHRGECYWGATAIAVAKVPGYLFPSFFEGFVIPPIEAMAKGAPVISSNTSSVPEILGDAALHCPADEPSAWIEAVISLACNTGLRADLISRGLTQASKYEWELSAERFYNWSDNCFIRVDWRS